MHIEILFRFQHHDTPAAVTGIEGEVTDIILPAVGDLVQHSDAGSPFEGKVIQRVFAYNLPTGEDVDGKVTVTLWLEPTVIH